MPVSSLALAAVEFAALFNLTGAVPRDGMSQSTEDAVPCWCFSASWKEPCKIQLKERFRARSVGKEFFRYFIPDFFLGPDQASQRSLEWKRIDLVNRQAEVDDSYPVIAGVRSKIETEGHHFVAPKVIAVGREFRILRYDYLPLWSFEQPLGFVLVREENGWCRPFFMARCRQDFDFDANASFAVSRLTFDDPPKGLWVKVESKHYGFDDSLFLVDLTANPPRLAASLTNRRIHRTPLKGFNNFMRSYERARTEIFDEALDRLQARK